MLRIGMIKEKYGVYIHKYIAITYENNQVPVS